MELWEILDENGNLTGEVLDKNNKRVWEKGVYHQGVDVWIINSENKILIQKRSHLKKLEPNVWAMTGGSVIKGETVLSALKREVQEELGIDIALKEVKMIKRFKTGNVWLNEYIIRKDIDVSKIVMQEDEVSEIKFASFDEIEEIFKNNMFMKNRWEFVREEIAKYLQIKL